MRKNLNRYKSKQKEIFNQAISEIKKGKKESKWIEYIFPLMHGIDIIEEKEYEISNVIEAREYLNDDVLLKNIIEILKLLQKSNIKEIMGEKELKKIHCSLTLLSYITNPNFKNLLIFRGYEEKLIKKVFTENKEFKIFNEIIEKQFENSLENKTIMLIESELLEYSLKENTLKNIEHNSLKLAEDILIKYSEFSPLVVSSTEQSLVLKKSKEYFQSLTEEEFEIFSKFNIDKTILKYANRVRKRIKKKVMINTIPTLILVGLITLSIINTPTTAYTIEENTIALLPTKSCMPAILEIENIEEIKKAKEEEIRQEQIRIEEEKKEEERRAAEKRSYELAYNYIEPTGVGNVDVVNIAMSQVGNIGGYPYWSWYGFSSRVDWCSIFVSWVADQAGVLNTAIPKFARASEGANWFINNSLFRSRDYIPREGDLIFFDWDYNGVSDHAGYVRYAENGIVYTVEGNTLNDDCSLHSYPMNSGYILGYGTPNY